MNITQFARQVLDARAAEEKEHAAWVAEEAARNRAIGAETASSVIEGIGISAAARRIWIEFPDDVQTAYGTGRVLVHAELREGTIRRRNAHLTIEAPMPFCKNKHAVITLDGARGVAVRTVRWDNGMEIVRLAAAEVIAEAF